MAKGSFILENCHHSCGANGLSNKISGLARKWAKFISALLGSNPTDS